MPSSAFRPAPMASDSLWTGPRVLVFVVLWVVALVGVRLAMGFYLETPLGAQETDYLAWSRDLQAGYASRPPGIAWAIAASVALCGSESVACVRMLQPLAMGLAGLGLAITAWLLWRSVAASVWAFAVFLSTPLIGITSQLATAEAWLLTAWAWALCAFVWAISGGGTSRSKLGNTNLSQGSNEVAWITVGLFSGLGLLVDYGMALFAVSAAVVLLRENLLTRAGPWLALLVAAAVMSPNLFWASEWGVPVFPHLPSAEPVNLLNNTPFITSTSLAITQFIFFSPLVFLAFLWLSLKSLFSWGKNTALSRGPGGSPWALDAGARLGLVFAWPVLAVFGFELSGGQDFANQLIAPASIGITLAVVGLWCAASNQIFRSRFYGRSVQGIGLPLTLVLNSAFNLSLFLMS